MRKWSSLSFCTDQVGDYKLASLELLINCAIIRFILSLGSLFIELRSCTTSPGVYEKPFKRVWRAAPARCAVRMLGVVLLTERAIQRCVLQSHRCTALDVADSVRGSTVLASRGRVLATCKSRDRDREREAIFTLACIYRSQMFPGDDMHGHWHRIWHTKGEERKG